MAKVLIVGNTAREMCIAKALERSNKVSRISVVPNHDGCNTGELPKVLPLSFVSAQNQQMASSSPYTVGDAATTPSQQNNHNAVNVVTSSEDIHGITKLAINFGADLVIVGPEQPLALGLADRLATKGIRCFGPNMAAAKIESSRSYAKDLMVRYGIPTPKSRVFKDFNLAKTFIERELDYNVVCKAGGLCGGRGVIIPNLGDKQETVRAAQRIMVEKEFGAAGMECILEEVVEGTAVSMMVISDGTRIACFPAIRDYKCVEDGDTGASTSGMGAYSPVLECYPGSSVAREIERHIQRIIDVLRENERVPFVGCLTARVIITMSSGPIFLGFNAHLGEPDIITLCPFMKSDIYDLFLAACEYRLDPKSLRLDTSKYSVTVSMVARGYPGRYGRGFSLENLSEAKSIPGTVLFLGSVLVKDGRFFANGGRVLAINATASELRAAAETAMKSVSLIQTEPENSLHFRTDIAQRAYLAMESSQGESVRQTITQVFTIAAPGIVAAQETIEKGISMGYFPAIALCGIVVTFQAFVTCILFNSCISDAVLGEVALSIGFIGFLIALFCEVLSRGKLVRPLRVGVIILGVYWTIFALIFTFGGPFTVTSNGYFASWGACFISYAALDREIAVSSWVVRRLGMNNSSRNTVAGQCLLSICSSSFIVMLACIQPCVDECEPTLQYGIVASVTSFVVSLVLIYIGYNYQELPPRIVFSFSVFFFVEWLLSLVILTFAGPTQFTLTGNGYFGIWFAMLSSSAFLREASIVYFDSKNKPATVQDLDQNAPEHLDTAVI